MIAYVVGLLWAFTLGVWVSRSIHAKRRSETNEHVIGAALIRSANDVRFALMCAPDCKITHWHTLERDGAADVEVRLTAKNAHFVESAA